MQWQSISNLLFVGILYALMPFACKAQPSSSDAALNEVHTAAAAYADALHRGDAEALARAWTDRADYIDSAGNRHKPHVFVNEVTEQNKKYDPDTSSQKRPKNTIRLIAPNVAIEDGTIPFGRDEQGTPLEANFTAVWVKSGNQWKIDALRELAIKSPKLNEHLKPLSWILGEWVGEAGNATVLVSAYPSEGGNQIIRKFAMLGDNAEVTATEQIAWDPAKKQIRSWIFDSQDGRGEAVWTVTDTGYRITTSETTGDGQAASSTAILTREDDDRCVWTVEQANLNNKSVPATKIEFHRAPEGE